MPNTNGAATELAPLLDGSTAGELIPELVRRGLQQRVELEVAAVIGAERHERSEERLGYRNGYRPRRLTTQVGDIDLLIPKRRSGGEGHCTTRCRETVAGLRQHNRLPLGSAPAR